MEILLIEANLEDQQLILAYTNSFLNLEVKVTVCNTLNDGKSLLANHKFDIVLLAVKSSNTQTLNTIDVLKSIASPAIIILSPKENKELSNATLKAGAHDFLVKENLSPDYFEKSLSYCFERSALSQKLIEANKTKDKLFSVLSHDLRSPLNSIISIINYLNEDAKNISIDELEEMLNSQAAVANAMLSLVNNLLHWSRLNLGSVKINPVKLNLKKVFNQEEELFIQALKNKKLLMQFHNEVQKPIVCDENLLETILRNLISNAIKFSNLGGAIHINFLQQTNNFKIEVIDEGIGMPAAIQNNLFDISKKVGRAGTLDEPSSGLGLFLVKEMVELMKGSIAIESAENKGTKVTVTLPQKVLV